MTTCTISTLQGGDIQKEFSKSQFIHLRKIVLTRLTTLNTRRGCEPARILIKDFLDHNSWIRKDELDNDDQELIERYKIVYSVGKGIGLIPVIIPTDCEKAIELLAEAKNHQHAGVCAENELLFPYRQQSEDGTIGYNEIRDVCKHLDIPVVTFTSIRHRGSTLFWALQCLQVETVDRFMEHVGHSKEIDKNIYAVPPALNMLKTVIPIISHLDQVNELRY